MNSKEVDKVSEIVRLYRSLDAHDKLLATGLLARIQNIDGLNVKKVSPLLPQDVAKR